MFGVLPRKVKGERGDGNLCADETDSRAGLTDCITTSLLFISFSSNSSSARNAVWRLTEGGRPWQPAKTFLANGFHGRAGALGGGSVGWV